MERRREVSIADPAPPSPRPALWNPPAVPPAESPTALAPASRGTFFFFLSLFFALRQGGCLETAELFPSPASVPTAAHSAGARAGPRAHRCPGRCATWVPRAGGTEPRGVCKTLPRVPQLPKPGHGPFPPSTGCTVSAWREGADEPPPPTAPRRVQSRRDLLGQNWDLPRLYVCACPCVFSCQPCPAPALAVGRGCPSLPWRNRTPWSGRVQIEWKQTLSPDTPASQGACHTARTVLGSDPDPGGPPPLSRNPGLRKGTGSRPQCSQTALALYWMLRAGCGLRFLEALEGWDTWWGRCGAGLNECPEVQGRDTVQRRGQGLGQGPGQRPGQGHRVEH